MMLIAQQDFTGSSRKYIMENFITNGSKLPINYEKMERLLNPKMSDHYQMQFYGKYGQRIYTIKVGRKWVFMRSNSHRVRMPLEKFKVHAFLQWRREAMTHASSISYMETGKYSRAKGWWKHYGFDSNPKYFTYDVSRLAW